jgi:hypothetical protein
MVLVGDRDLNARPGRRRVLALALRPALSPSDSFARLVSVGNSTLEFGRSPPGTSTSIFPEASMRSSRVIAGMQRQHRRKMERKS